jgi:hypothetical protein
MERARECASMKDLGPVNEIAEKRESHVNVIVEM